MDIRSLGGRAAAQAKNDAAPRLKTDSAMTDKGRANALGDRSSVSSGTERLRSLSQAAKESPELRPDAVARGRALIESGDIDAPGLLDRAAEGFLSEGL